MSNLITLKESKKIEEEITGALLDANVIKMNEFKENFNNLPLFIRNMNIIVSNDLPFLPQKFDLNQKRILAYAIGLIQKEHRENSPKDFSNYTFTIQISHFKQAFNLEDRGGSLYDQVKLACKKLSKEQINYTNERKNLEIDVNWCQHVVYENDKGRIHIKFTEQIAKYLTQLANNYVKYNLFISHSFKSLYSTRIYEIMQTRKDTNTVFMSYKDFRDILEVPSSYNKPSIVREKIIKKVEEEFKDKGINFSCELTRDKRFDGNYRVTLKADKNENDLLLWLKSKENTLKEEGDKIKLIEASSMEDPVLPF